MGMERPPREILRTILAEVAVHSNVIVRAVQGVPDIPAALGFSIYSVLIVLLLMAVLEILQAAIDPRVREEIIRS